MKSKPTKFEEKLKEILDAYSVVETSHLYHHEHDKEKLVKAISTLCEEEVRKARLLLARQIYDDFEIVFGEGQHLEYNYIHSWLKAFITMNLLTKEQFENHIKGLDK